jgi:hypothetical protein
MSGKDFSLSVFPSSSATSTSVCYIDNRASHHMIGVRENFSYLTEIEYLEVVLGDDSMVK